MNRSNKTAFDEFVNTIINNPKTMPEVVTFMKRLLDDEEMITYLQCSSILMIRFPDLFQKILIGAHQHLADKITKRINEKVKSSAVN